jgi:hypothetical protein
MAEMTQPKDVRRRNRRLGLLLISLLAVLYLVAVVGVLVLN